MIKSRLPPSHTVLSNNLMENNQQYLVLHEVQLSDTKENKTESNGKCERKDKKNLSSWSTI